MEFALVGTAAFTIMFGCIEIGRLLFVWNTLAEATRRAARVAAVMPMNDAAVKSAVTTYGAGVDHLTTANVSVSYLNSAGTVTATSTNVRFVQVSITGVTHSLLIPFVTKTVTVPSFSTTLPAESLGAAPPS